MAKARWVIALALFCTAAHAQGPPSIRVSKSSLSYSAYVGGDPPPRQSIIVTSTSQTQVRFNVTSDNPRLSFFPRTAVTPARISVAVDQSDVPAGRYQGQIFISDPANAIYGSIAVPVTYTVDPREPELEVSPALLRFAAREGDVDENETLFVRNSGGGGRISFTVSLQTNSPWIVSPFPIQGVVGPNIPFPVKIKISPQAVKAGSYRAVLRFTSVTGSVDVPISLFVTAPGQVIVLNPRGFQLEVRQGAGTSFTKDVTIFNKGIGVFDWTASIIQGADWLRINRTSGTAGGGNPGTIRVSTDDNKLPVGTHYGLVRISSPTANNSPQLVPIVLNVVDAAEPPRVGISPAGLVFFAVAGQPTPPASKSLQIFASSLQPIAYQNSSYTNDGAGWLTISSSSGTASTQRPGQTTVSVNHAGLQRGVYFGEIAYSFSSSDIRAANVTLVVLPAGARLSSNQRAAIGCSPTRLTMTQSGLPSNFSGAVGWPIPITIQLADDCGDPVQNGQIVLTYSNGDPAQSMTLTDPQDGSYSATWTPTKNASSVSITARAASLTLPDISAQLTGTVLANKVPILFPDGTVDNFSFLGGAPLAPGTIAAMFGIDLAPGVKAPGVIPFRTEVDGTRVLIGGFEAPIHFVSGGQINAQIPVELTPNRQYQVLISANGALTVPDIIDLAAVQPTVQAPAPGNFVTAQHGNFDIITTASPAKPGEAIILYALGLGQTDPPARSGTAAPSNPLARALTQPTVTIGGKSARILFAGLTPGFVGLHQINLVVPDDAPTGNLEITINQGGVTSNPGVLPVRR